MRLADYAKSRDNNFTLLRLIAAMMVVFAHSFSVLGLPWFPDIMLDKFGRNSGEMALDALFVTSGFLVTASLLNRGHLIEFPLGAGPQTLPGPLAHAAGHGLPSGARAHVVCRPREYFASHLTWEYFWKCGTVIGGLRWSLPGVFETMPLRNEFNGSLWTLPVEARMYVYLSVPWIVFAVVPRFRLKALTYLAPVIALAWGVMLLRTRFTTGVAPPQTFAVFMFLYGSALYYWRDKIPMGWGVLAALVAVMALSTIDKNVAFVVYLLGLPLIFLHVAYLPRGVIRKFNDFGDYSYGVYIYAFPIQQTLAFLFPGISLIVEILGSAALSFGAAWLSWHGVEKRAMAMKGSCAEATERALHLGLARIASAVR